MSRSTCRETYDIRIQAQKRNDSRSTIKQRGGFRAGLQLIRAAAAIRKSFIRLPKFRRRGGAVAP